MACGERVRQKLVQTQRAFAKLKAVAELLDSVDREVVYEVAAKRFEYTYEALWKAVRLFLLEQHGIECNSPMQCFKSAYKVGLIAEDEHQHFPSIVRKRNDIVHQYDFSMAAALLEFILQTVVPAFQQIIDRMVQECQNR